jgi:hypothetical protein
VNVAQREDCIAAIKQRGLIYEEFIWMKSDMTGKTNPGGARQMICTEKIIVAYKYEGSSVGDRSYHYSLLKRLTSARQVSDF